jgi:hypothetical protein
MRPTYIRRIRRKPAVSKDNGAFRKEAQKENTFFGEAAAEPFFASTSVLQRKCASCANEENEISRMPEKKEEEEKKLQRKEEKKEEDKPLQRMAGKEEEEKKLNRKENNEGGVEGTTGEYIHDIGGKGAALTPQTQVFFGSRMGYDFGHVRIHTGAAAAQSAKDINAQAYTYQNHIVFDEGKYNDQSAEGKKLLAHELTHVVQQGDAGTDNGNAVSRRLNITTPYPTTDDFEPSSQFRQQSKALGRCDSVLNGTTQLPSLGAQNFEKSLVKPDLDERNLGNIPRPNLSDPSLDKVRANKEELAYGAYGKKVQLVQEALIAWGKGLDEPVQLLPKYGADKDYRGETRGAVVFFQEKHPGLAVDGIVGDLTLAALTQEMTQLTGSIFSIKSVGVNDFTGLIHMPPPSAKWTPIVTSTNSFFNNSIDPFDQAQLAGQFAKCNVKFVSLTFLDAGGVVPAVLQHERVHEKDQLKTINDHLLKWDVDLSVAQVINFKFKAANRTEADKKLYVLLGIPNPLKLSQNIMNEFKKDNKNFHQSAAGQGISTSLGLPSCTRVEFTFKK